MQIKPRQLGQQWQHPVENYTEKYIYDPVTETVEQYFNTFPNVSTYTTLSLKLWTLLQNQAGKYVLQLTNLENYSYFSVLQVRKCRSEVEISDNLKW